MVLQSYTKPKIQSTDYPAKTFGDPAATAVQDVRASPILPHPLLLINTEEEPTVIGAE